VLARLGRRNRGECVAGVWGAHAHGFDIRFLEEFRDAAVPRHAPFFFTARTRFRDGFRETHHARSGCDVPFVMRQSNAARADNADAQRLEVENIGAAAVRIGLSHKPGFYN
jgi:hypothetical protein